MKKCRVLTGFDGRATSTIREVELPVFTECVNFHRTFLVIDSKSAYNGILGKPWIYRIKVVSSTYHQLIKSSTPQALEK